MPCSNPIDDYVGPSERDSFTLEINLLTARLCEACRVLEEHGLVPKELTAWWKQHKKEDENRQKAAAEKLAKAEKTMQRKEYLRSVKERLKKQLSPDELEALGLK
jgi:hypothetical protein